MGVLKSDAIQVEYCSQVAFDAGHVSIPGPYGTVTVGFAYDDSEMRYRVVTFVTIPAGREMWTFHYGFNEYSECTNWKVLWVRGGPCAGAMWQVLTPWEDLYLVPGE